MAQHTPGPWTVGLREGSNRPENYAVGVVSDDGTDFYAVAYMEIKNVEANAHLIAAAPELLEALKNLLREVEEAGNANADDYGWPTVVPQARAAIAKAKP